MDPVSNFSRWTKKISLPSSPQHHVKFVKNRKLPQLPWATANKTRAQTSRDILRSKVGDIPEDPEHTDNETTLLFRGQVPPLKPFQVSSLVTKINQITNLGLRVVDFEHFAKPEESTVRLDFSQKGFWTGKMFIHLPTICHHRHFHDLMNGKCIDLGFEQIRGEVTNELIDFSGIPRTLEEFRTATHEYWEGVAREMGGEEPVYSLSSHSWT